VLIAALVALFTGVTPGALADQDIVANTGAATTGFTTPNVTMAQGEKLTFQNNDATVMHNVTSTDNGSDGKPLFHSATIGPGSSFVDGSQYLTSGSYHFYCTLHPQTMTGTLTVSTAGTPVPRPGGGGGGGGSSGGGNAGAGNAPAGGGNSTAPSKAKKKKNRRKHHRKRARGRRHAKRHRSHA